VAKLVVFGFFAGRLTLKEPNMKTQSIASILLLSGALISQAQPSTTSSSSTSPSPSTSTSSTEKDRTFAPPGQSRKNEDLPPGRPFTDNPPPGRPFQDKDVSGRPFQNQQENSQTNSNTASSTAAPSASGLTNANTSSSGTNANTQSGNIIRDASGASVQATNSTVGGSQSTAINFAAGAQANPQITQKVTQVQQVLNTFKANTTINQQQKIELQQTIINVIGTQPGVTVQTVQPFVIRLVDDLAIYLPRATLAVDVQNRLANAIVLIATRQIEPAQLESSLGEVRQVLTSNGLEPIAAQTVACDLHLLGAAGMSGASARAIVR
jgi:hypothetical protein